MQSLVLTVKGGVLAERHNPAFHEAAGYLKLIVDLICVHKFLLRWKHGHEQIQELPPLFITTQLQIIQQDKYGKC